MTEAIYEDKKFKSGISTLKSILIRLSILYQKLEKYVTLSWRTKHLTRELAAQPRPLAVADHQRKYREELIYTKIF